MSNRKSWLAERRTGIGGSDVAAILGLSRHKTAYDVWSEKTGRQEPDDDTVATRAGRLFEEVVFAYYEERHNCVLTKAAANVRKAPLSPLIANVDRLHGDTIVEGKTTVSYVFRSWKGELPRGYYAQAQHYMDVLDLPHAVVAVLVLDTREYYEFPVERDPEWHEVADALQAWWHDHVVADVPPAIVYGTIEPVDGSQYQATRADIQTIAELRKIEADIKLLEESAEVLKTALKTAMGDNEVLMTGLRPAYTYKNMTSSRIDPKALRSKYPDIAKEVTTTSTTRVFRGVK